MDENDPRFYARNDDPETSKESARMLRPSAMWMAVLTFLYENDRIDGWADFEISEALAGQLGHCSWHRVSDVRARGWADWVEGLRRHNPQTNRSVGVTRITPEGLEWLGVG